ncbi:MAG: VPLPA-CTERM sorting domain-containing protein [Pseudomonadota bacterium]
MIRSMIVAAALLVSYVTTASAATYTATFVEKGGNVVLTVGGSVDTTGYSFLGQSGHGPAGLVDPSRGSIVTGAGTFWYNVGATSFSSFGTGVRTDSSSNTGDAHALAFNINEIILPVGYVSGTALSSTTTWTGETFASLGLAAGQYSSTNGNTTFDVNVGAAPVPLPASLPLVLAGLGGLALLRRTSARS